MKITTLSAGKTRLVKRFLKDKVESYPNVSKMTSAEYELSTTTDLSEFEDLIRAVSSKGGCILKGGLLKQLKHESRAGATDRHGLAEYMILDFDGTVLPRFVMPNRKLTERDMIDIAEEAIEMLPPVFRESSYIMQASSSLGQKGSRLSFHLFFVLNTPLQPRMLKDYLKALNFEIDFLNKSVELSSTGYALMWPLDPSVADNSKLIFISTPDFVDVEDPFDNPADRIVRRERRNVTLDIAQAIADMPNPELLSKKVDAKRKALRLQRGLPTRRAVYKTRMFGGERHEVLDNPEQVSIKVMDDSRLPFIRCNINGGDSGAYFFNIANPQYMGNFKGEPYFLIEEADPKFYASIFETYGDKLKEFRKDPFPVVFRDFYTDGLYNGLYNPQTNKFTDDFPLTTTSRPSVEGFMAAHGHEAPELIPEARLTFDPRVNDPAVNLDVKPYYINLYQKTAYMSNPAVCKTFEYNSAHELAGVCPSIYTLILHVVGGHRKEARHFINWLAYIYQFRQKTGVAWVFGGVQGTGKGLLLNRVIRPLLGPSHVPIRTLENLEEQFNSYMQTAILVGVDEFRMFNSKGGLLRIADKLKNQITEPTVTIRAMHSNQVEVPSYSNFIFLTNRPDAIKIEESDRRYCVGSRQERKLLDARPELIRNLGSLDQELFMFAGFMNAFDVDVLQATRALENAAKSSMKSVSMSLPEEFCHAVKSGDLEFFVPVLDLDVSDTFNAGRILAAKRAVTNWIEATRDGIDCVARPEDLRMVYQAQMEVSHSSREFNKMLERGGLNITRARVESHGDKPEKKQVRGIPVSWSATPEWLNEVYETYFPPTYKARA